MQTSESVKEITAALLGFHKQIGKVAKSATNPFFKSKYADLSTIQAAIAEPLAENGLVIAQFPEGEHGLTTRLMHESGEWMESTYFMHPVKPSPQDAGSAITYQRRYAIGAILNLNIDEDDDGNAASQNGKKITAYNHKEIGTPDKPLITNEQFKKLCERIKTEGDLQAYYKALDAFSFESTQKSLLDKVYQTAKKQKEIATA